ncbi:hypothetical protein PoMZ_05496 [Pyricularia oryzae]|uniref:Uncharacterized protein n=1 Tax=Pyricularia oryzae TaxID=318829 RepID=A0A4P7NNC4_PYROR|nr:hypothetical protein PoMZ_05496 [Pyricularia oryzae]
MATAVDAAAAMLSRTGEASAAEPELDEMERWVTKYKVSERLYAWQRDANALQPGACYVGMRRRIEEVRGKKQRMQISTFNVLTAPFLEKARVEVERRHLAANIL